MSGRTPFTAVALFAFSSAVILISVYILFSYVTGLFDRQSGLEKTFQARLSQESAVEMLRRDLTNGDILQFSSLPDYTLDEQTTSFSMVELSNTPPEVLSWNSPGDTVLQAAAAGNSIFVISGIEEGLRVDRVSWTNPDNSREAAVLPGWDPSSVSAAGVETNGGPVLFILETGEGEGELAVIGEGAGTELFQLDLPSWNDGSFLSAGYSTGSPALLISSGTNRAVLFTADPLSMQEVTSPAGTTPVFLNAGTMFGETGPVFRENDGFEVLSTVTDDFNSDGVDDLVFAGRNSLAFRCGSTGEVLLDTLPRERLLAWGTVDGSGLLNCRWEREGGPDRWRVLLGGRFVESSGPEMLPLPWLGRLWYSRGSVMGRVRDQVVYASENTGETRRASPAAAGLICQLNGRGPDLIISRGQGIEVQLDPLDGDGLEMILESDTFESGGESLAGGLWSLRVFGTGAHRRVRVGRAG
ncbi:MAG: hypothetical protein R6U39_03940 [Candidatus Aegiribacteria sp.]